MKQVNRKESGFTLVELLIVVAIIGILAAIAIPQFTKYKRNAAEANANAALANCMSELSATYAETGLDNATCTNGITLDLNGTTGAISVTGGSPVDVKGISVGCQIESGNVVNCTAQ